MDPSLEHTATSLDVRGPGAAKRETAEGLAPGTRVDHFKVLRLIGRGGMGEVYLARDTQLGRKVALKMIRPGTLGEGDARERFLREARITARFNHPHIVAIHSVGTFEEHPYVALEYVEGESLRERLDDEQPGLLEGLRIGRAIAEALVEAHRHGVLHRDLKPQNVLLGRDGRLRVLDFGLAKLAEGPPPQESVPRLDESVESMPGAHALFESRAGSLRGTPAYMAPEQWREEACTPATDVWALGLILHLLVTGRRPFPGAGFYQLCLFAGRSDPMPSVAEARADLPAPLVALVDACLQKDPAARPDASSIVEALTQLLGREREPSAAEHSPFRGLLPFAERHADQYFGRDAEVAAFVERLREQPVLPVVGPSGAGKSSFVQAGVFPRLREQGRWDVLRVRPGRQPFEALATRLLARESTSRTRFAADTYASGDAVDAEAADGDETGPTQRSQATVDGADAIRDLAAELAANPARLTLALADRAERGRTRVLLFVDQLEELATLVPEAARRRAFMRAICGAADDPEGPLRVVLTLRDDFLGRLTEIPEAQQALGRVTVLRPPDRTALGDILERPAALRGYRFEDAELVDEMIAEVEGAPAALPLLQFGAQRLWEARDREAHVLTRAAYREMGGLAGALARHADEVLAGLSPAEERLAGRLLVRLVTPEGSRRILPRGELLDGLGEAAPPVLERLTGARTVLLRRGRSGDDPECELVHESLVVHWDRLQRWLEESREDRAFLAELEQAVTLWQQRGRPAEEVWTGPALAEARARAGRIDHLPRGISAFLEAGRAREAAQRRRRRWTIGLAGGLLVLVAVVSVVAALRIAAGERETARERDGARRARAVAEARRRQAESAERLAAARGAQAMLEGARAALSGGDRLVARARLRSALEIADGPSARALWWRLSQGNLIWRRKLNSWVNAVAMAPDGRTVAAACSDGVVHLVDTVTGAVRLLRGHADQVFAVAFSPDGRRLASGTWSGEIGLWDARTGAFQRLGVHRGGVKTVAFSPDSRRLVSGGHRGTLQLWDVLSARRQAAVRGTGSVLDAAFGPAGRVVAAGAQDGTVRVYEVPTLQRRLVMRGHTGTVDAVAVDPRGRFVASAGSDGTVRLWGLPGGDARAILRGHAGSVHGVAVGPRGALLATGGRDRTVRVWDVAAGQERVVFRGHQRTVWSVAFGRRGRRVVSGSGDTSVRLWRVPARRRVLARRAHGSVVNGAAFAQAGKSIVSGDGKGRVLVWSVATGRPTRVLRGHQSAVYGVAVSPDGKTVATSGDDHTVRLWDAGRWQLRRVIKGHGDSVSGIDFGPASRRLVAASGDRTVRLWDTVAGTVKVLRGHTNRVTGAAFGPRGRFVASAGADRTVRLWDVATGRSAFVARAHTAWVWAVRLHPQGRLLASASSDRTVRLWRVPTGEPWPTRPKFGPFPGRAYWIDWHPDGKRIGVPLSSGTAHIRALDGGGEVVLRGHRAEVNYLRFGPRGKRVLTTSDDGTVRLWRVADGRPVWRAPLLRPRSLELFNHRGWHRLATGDRFVPPTERRWRRAVRDRARVADESPAGATLCIGNHSGRLEIWDVAADRRRAERVVGRATGVWARRGGCLALVGGVAQWYRRGGGEARLAGRAVTAVLPAGAGVWLAGERKATWHLLDRRAAGGGASRIQKPTFAVDVGVTALGLVGRWLVAGYRDGNLALHNLRPGGAPAPRFTFEGVPSSAVVRVIPGPSGTLIAGFADGTVGLWSLRNGIRLHVGRLHGAVVHLLRRDGRLYAASELGQHVVWDLRVFERPYCALLAQVWQRIPIVWERGLPQLRKPPANHRCRTALAPR